MFTLVFRKFDFRFAVLSDAIGSLLYDFTVKNSVAGGYVFFFLIFRIF